MPINLIGVTVTSAHDRIFHTRPIVGQDVSEALTLYRDAIQFVHDQTVRLMNKGLTPDEIIDPRYIAEIIRQWSTFHPEFALLPRKFKISSYWLSKRSCIVQAHDIGLEFSKNTMGMYGD